MEIEMKFMMKIMQSRFSDAFASLTSLRLATAMRCLQTNGE